jgi:hypothetical protein
MKRASIPARWIGAAVLALLVVAGLGSSGALAQAPPSQPAMVVSTANSPGMSAVVTWNGADVSSASGISSAISTDFSSTIDVHYTWASSGPQYTISDARLQMFYFGFALGTRDILDSNPVAATNGTFDMPWDPGVLQWLLIGSYALTASLLSPNGTVQWSEQFFLHITAPAAIGAVIPILLILIGIYEAYSLARSGRQAAIRPTSSKGKGAGPVTPASSTATKDPESGTGPSSDAPKGDSE